MYFWDRKFYCDEDNRNTHTHTPSLWASLRLMYSQEFWLLGANNPVVELGRWVCFSNRASFSSPRQLYRISDWESGTAKMLMAGATHFELHSGFFLELLAQSSIFLPAVFCTCNHYPTPSAVSNPRVHLYITAAKVNIWIAGVEQKKNTIFSGCSVESLGSICAILSSRDSSLPLWALFAMITWYNIWANSEQGAREC